MCYLFLISKTLIGKFRAISPELSLPSFPGAAKTAKLQFQGHCLKFQTLGANFHLLSDLWVHILFMNQ